jgi:RsiW-degrading membrane proteinase PrsW (M82 family)
MELFLASTVLGIVPMVIYALIVWRIDRWEKEPFSLILAAFLWGAVPSIFFALIAQTVLAVPPGEGGEVSLMSELYAASFLAPLTEEIFKGLGLIILFRRYRDEIDSVLDGLVYGSVVGFGFAAVENIFYFWSQPDAGSLIFLFFLRAFVFGMLHALFTGLLGVGLALGKFSSRPLMKFLWPAAGLGLAMFTHALHNYFATLGGAHLLYAVLGITIGMIWFITMIVVCLRHENRWIRIHLSDEVARGVLCAEQAIDAATFSTRSSLSAFSRGFGLVLKRKRLLHEATELAYQKQKRERLGADPAREMRINELRESVRTLSRQDPLVLSGEITPGKLLPPPLPPTRLMPPPLPGRG